jgi:Relaxase/Mobilisation nuclease domain
VFAKISTHASIHIPLRYNELKVAEGKAECIGAENFLKSANQLSIQDKMDRFGQRSSLNEMVIKNCVHISLSFGKSDNLDNERMTVIGDRFMERMHFKDQPYTIYRHYDAGHPHIHIVATTIQADGSKIHLHPKHLRESIAICRELESEFSLQPNRRSTTEDLPTFQVQQAQKVVYGEPDLKRQVSDVLNTVVDHYQYTSMDEFNAILREYNVTANRGSEHSMLQKVGGLYYHVLNEGGEKIGVPLKAGEFLLKPTLHRLEEHFALSQSQREASRERLHAVIDWSLAGQAPDWNRWREDLERDGISVVVSKSKTDSEEHLYFIDHRTKSAFSAESLAPHYTLHAIRERCRPEERLVQEEIPSQRLKISL